MKFYAQQVTGTLAICAFWVIAVYALTYTSPNDAALAESQVPAGKEVLETREEATGELVRIHRHDADGAKTEVEVRFKDKTTGVIYLSSLGYIKKIVERRPDGSYLVFSFERKGRSLVKVQGFRADDSLRCEIVPDKTTLKTTRFAEDGSTVVAVEQIHKDGSFEAQVYKPGASSPWLEYSLFANRTSATLKVKDPTGAVTSTEAITRSVFHGGIGMGRFGFFMGGPPIPLNTIVVTQFSSDGKTPVVTQTWRQQGNSASLLEATFYRDDGKTVQARVSPYQGMAGFIIGLASNAKSSSYRVETFAADGTAGRIILLDSDFKVTQDPTIGNAGSDSADRAVSGCSEDNIESVLDTILAKPYGLNLKAVLPNDAPALEPNHLRQLLSN